MDTTAELWKKNHHLSVAAHFSTTLYISILLPLNSVGEASLASKSYVTASYLLEPKLIRCFYAVLVTSFDARMAVVVSGFDMSAETPLTACVICYFLCLGQFVPVILQWSYSSQPIAVRQGVRSGQTRG